MTKMEQGDETRLARVEPFYRMGGTEQLDKDLITDDSFEHTDSRDWAIWPGGSPFNRMDFSHGPLSSTCVTCHLAMIKNIVLNHISFWIPWFLDIIIAPVIGVLFYCGLKGSILFKTCLDRVFKGNGPDQGKVSRKYGGGGDPFAAIAPSRGR